VTDIKNNKEYKQNEDDRIRHEEIDKLKKQEN